MIKVTRRTFLKGSAATGAAVALSGTLLNTLRPAKAEAAETGTISWSPTTCVGCTTWCSVEVKTQTAGGITRAVDVTGNRYAKRGDPTNGDFGIACPRARIAIQEAYDPDRVKVAMKRTNPIKGRGIDPGFIPYPGGNAAAIAEVGQKMVAMRNAGNSHKWAWLRGRYSYVRTTTYDGIKKIYGSPNGISHSAICAEAENMGRSLCIGRWGYDDYDLDNSKYLILWGVDAVSSNRMVSGAIRRLGKRMNEDLTVVAVDPRLNATASKAHKWVAPKPGTDGALALAMAHHILVSKLWNQTFVGYTYADTTFNLDGTVTTTGTENVTYGLATWWTKALFDKTPEWAETITGISAATIREIAAGFAAAGTQAISWIGPGIAMQPNGAYGAWAAIALNGLVGSFDAPGGELVSEPSNSYYTDSIPAYSSYVDAIATTGGAKQKLIKYATSGTSLDVPAMEYDSASKAYKLGAISPTARLADCINDKMPYETKMLIGAMNNFAFSAVGAGRFEKAYSGDMSGWSATADDDAPPFYVDLTTHASETTMFADIVIPAKHLGLEVRASTHPRATGRHKTHSLYNQVIEPLWDSISPETEFAYMLADAMATAGFTKLKEFYEASGTYGSAVTGVTVTDAASFDLAANIWHGTKGGIVSGSTRAEEWAWLNRTPGVGGHELVPGSTSIYAGYGISQATKTYSALTAPSTSVFKTGPTGGGAGAGEGRVQFYNPTFKAALESHAAAHSTTVGAVLAACHYDRIGGLVLADPDQAYVPNWEDPYIQGDEADYPFIFVDCKSRLNREGRSANTTLYNDFKSCDPGDESWEDVVKMNPADAGSLVDGQTVTIESPISIDGMVQKVTCKLKLWDGVRPGTVVKAYGQGHWAYGLVAAETFGSVAAGGNNNTILPGEFERLSGAAARNATVRVKIY